MPSDLCYVRGGNCTHSTHTYLAYPPQHTRHHQQWRQLRANHSLTHHGSSSTLLYPCYYRRNSSRDQCIGQGRPYPTISLHRYRCDRGLQVPRHLDLHGRQPSSQRMLQYWDGTGQFITHQFPENKMEYRRFASLHCQARTWSPFSFAKKAAPWHRWLSL